MLPEQPAIGVLCLNSKFPKPAGHIRNSAGLPFPILCHVIENASIKKIMGRNAKDLLPSFLLAAKRLENDGVCAITGSCGFMALFQRDLAEVVKVPVFSSSLIQLPLAFRVSGCQSPVGILTANKKSLKRKYFTAVGAAQIPMIIQGLEDYQEFSEVILQAKRDEMDFFKIEKEVLDAAKKLRCQSPNLKAIVLECTDLSPYTHKIQNELNVPVYDIISLATMIHSVVLRKPLSLNLNAKLSCQI